MFAGDRGCTLISSGNISRPRLLPSISVAAFPAEPMKLSYISSSGPCSVLTRQTGCLGVGRNLMGIFIAGGVCFHRGSCSDDGVLSGAAPRLLCGVVAVANARDVFALYRFCRARVHRAHTNGAREGAIGGCNGDEVRLIEQERSEGSLRLIFGCARQLSLHIIKSRIQQYHPGNATTAFVPALKSNPLPCAINCGDAGNPAWHV